MRRLLIRPGAIGDCILSLPALEYLRADYTEVWVAGANVSLIRFADRVRSIASTGLDLVGLSEIEAPPHLVEDLRGFDSIVSWYGSARPEFRDAMARLGLPVRFLSALPPPGCAEHAADFYLREAGQEAKALPHIRVPRREGCFAVIHPFSGSASKNWPLERYRDLARWVERRLPVHWCAGPEEPLEGATRFEDLYELACWLGGARMYIGNDSGITHLAAAVGTPVVALYGLTDPRVWAPRGPEVRVVAAGAPGDSIDRIALDDVRSVVNDVLR